MSPNPAAPATSTYAAHASKKAQNKGERGVEREWYGARGGVARVGVARVGVLSADKKLLLLVTGR